MERKSDNADNADDADCGNVATMFQGGIQSRLNCFQIKQKGGEEVVKCDV